MKTTIFDFHKIGEKRTIDINSVSKVSFSKSIKILLASECKALALEDSLSSVSKETFSIVFDDAFENVFYNALPLLKENKIPATLFVISSYIGKENFWDYRPNGLKHMDRKMVREASDRGFEIGSHSATHKRLDKLTSHELKSEIIDSKHTIEDITGREVRYFSYPFGRYSGKVLEYIEKANYKAAFSISPKKLKNNPLFQVPLRGVYGFHTGYD